MLGAHPIEIHLGAQYTTQDHLSIPWWALTHQIPLYGLKVGRDHSNREQAPKTNQTT